MDSFEFDYGATGSAHNNINLKALQVPKASDLVKVLNMILNKNEFKLS